MYKVRQSVDQHGLRDCVRIIDGVAYEDLSDLYRLATVSVSVPFSDGTSMSVLEAMASGSAPIVSDLPSLREWIRDGWNGYLVAPSGKDALAQRIVQLLKDVELRETFAVRNLELIRQRAEQASEMVRMEELYRHALKETAEPRLPSAN
jgi:glycosyltransferase involved in cell wall biosynthesis